MPYSPYQTQTTNHPDVWQYWVATSATTLNVWPLWIQQTSSTGTTTVQEYAYANNNWLWHTWLNQTPITHTRDQILYQQQRQRAWLEAENARQREGEQEREQARVKAKSLLESCLTAEQREELEHHHRFTVVGSRGRRYCIRAAGQSGNVVLLDHRDGMIGRFCAHPGQYVPDPDAWLAQKLALEFDEDEFLRTANLHEGRFPTDLVRERISVLTE